MADLIYVCSIFIFRSILFQSKLFIVITPSTGYDLEDGGGAWMVEGTLKGLYSEDGEAKGTHCTINTALSRVAQWLLCDKMYTHSIILSLIRFFLKKSEDEVTIHLDNYFIICLLLYVLYQLSI